MSCGLAIFVKTPEFSPVKSRLWPALGRPAAATFHRLAAAAVASVAARAAESAGLHVHWAVAESEALTPELWPGLPQLSQGEGCLGRRMARIHRLLRHRYRSSLLIGADIPQLQAAELATAADWLTDPEPRLALGRAADGGFWLFGANVPLAEARWIGVPYSSAATATRFVAAMTGTGTWRELATLRDVDEPADPAPLRAALAALADPTAEQSRLLAWLDARELPQAARP